MLLTLIAEHPAEVCGARWNEDVDLIGSGTVAVGNTRTIVYDRRQPKGFRNTVVEKEPKTHNGRRVRLYDTRHACLSWMANNGVPDTVVPAWAGHSDLSFTKRVYVLSPSGSTSTLILRASGLARTSWVNFSADGT
ncbi:tyrosine-type recombinase/integrase [Streptomyces echinoruber]|uniref:Tyr recombinase domain-containing protein n=1 Tax=Streptomyces echinoruber TaxID=68898 RepID=A0A918RP46_9ACTN|nr:tyrosine-type recombinase/integrase [Streptomyces echinoruber]GHA07502.1 hypothetical protein GCM10010389_53460 [Streptomyces echinoruber]